MLKLKNILGVACMSLVLLGLVACTAVNDMLKNTFAKPSVSVKDAKIESLSFESIGLAFDLNVKNPNPVSVAMAGYDYEFLLNSNGVLSGKQDERVELAAEGESVVRVPVTLRFKDLYELVRDAKNLSEADYQINLGFSFELPVLGVQRIPVTHAGRVPLLKLPKLSLESFKLNNLSVGGADMTLALNLSNPNASSFVLKDLGYNLAVAGKKWAAADGAQDIEVQALGNSLIEFPVNLNFFEIGRSVFSLLTSDAPVDYHFVGSFDLESSLPLLGAVKVPFNRKGEIKVLK